MTVLSARQVGYAVNGKHLVEAVDLEVNRGEIVVLVGPNGAGKSTLLRLMSGDLQPTTGEVSIGDRRLSDYRLSELALLRAVMPQQSLLQFAFTAQDVVMMGRSPRHRRHHDGDRDDEIVEAAMQRSETIHLAERIYPTLSGGEQGRVTLARVLAQETPILLLDEPTAALDIRHQQLVMDVARRLASEGAAILAVLHDLNLAAMYANRIALLSRGRMMACGDPWSVLTESTLSSVFDYPVSVTAHPRSDCPLVLPLPGSRDDDASRETFELVGTPR